MHLAMLQAIGALIPTVPLATYVYTHVHLFGRFQVSVWKDIIRHCGMFGRI